jgi:CRP-like cAMP-binding protein
MMDLISIDKLLGQIPVFHGLSPEHLELIAGCASNVRFDEGQMLFNEGDPADRFFVVRHGLVAIELYEPQKGKITIETVRETGVVGWSWLIPPYRWHFDARAVESTRAVALDAQCLRGKCEQDTRLGYDLMQRFASVMTKRLQNAAMQLLDVYGHDRT